MPVSTQAKKWFAKYGIKVQNLGDAKAPLKKTLIRECGLNYDKIAFKHIAHHKAYPDTIVLWRGLLSILMKKANENKTSTIPVDISGIWLVLHVIHPKDVVWCDVWGFPRAINIPLCSTQILLPCHDDRKRLDNKARYNFLTYEDEVCLCPDYRVTNSAAQPKLMFVHMVAKHGYDVDVYLLEFGFRNKKHMLKIFTAMQWKMPSA